MPAEILSFAARHQVQKIAEPAALSPFPPNVIAGALKFAGIERKVAAPEMGMSQSQLCKVLNGKVPITMGQLQRIVTNRDAFWAALPVLNRLERERALLQRGA